MGVAKVIINDVTEIDLTADTVTVETLAEGATAHNSKGDIITGTMTSGGGDEWAIAYIQSNKGEGITSLPDGITSIGDYAFSGCTSLALTSLPSGITSIGNSAFSGCTSLALTSLPAGITSIGSRTFYNCTSLTSLTFKGTPTTIASDTFYQCSNLTDIYVPWSEGAVANAPWGATNATIHYDSEV
jgi:hypothetical protein